MMNNFILRDNGKAALVQGYVRKTVAREYFMRFNGAENWQYENAGSCAGRKLFSFEERNGKKHFCSIITEAMEKKKKAERENAAAAFEEWRKTADEEILEIPEQDLEMNGAYDGQGDDI